MTSSHPAARAPRALCWCWTCRQSQRNSHAYVREQPLTAVGVALASGFLLSWALRQR